ncbi:MAG TPA: hypothetical protein VIG08_17555 [Gemmatimonadales bacterium]|jgi:hypothetical protein
MHTTSILHTIVLGTCLAAATLTARSTGSRFEAHTTGAKTLTLRGSAEFGPVRGTQGSGPIVLTLGATSPTGAVLFTLRSVPGPGVYHLSADPSEGIQALVVTGPPTASTGAFRARAGRLTITRSTHDLIEGRFEIDAIGFDAADPADEDQELTVFGKFTATATAPAADRLSHPEVELPL